MSIWNKVLAGLIVVATIAFCYMTAGMMKIRMNWYNSMAAHEKAIKSTQAENVALADGIRPLRLAVFKAALSRGRVWRDCAVHVTNPETGVLSVTTKLPQPHGIADKSVLYLFSQTDIEKGGRYLGEFRAAGVDEAKNLVGLQPTQKLSQPELKRLVEQKGPIVMYETMPADSHDVFAEMKPEEIKALLPEPSLAEYTRDGQAAAATDSPDRKVKEGDKEVYSRRLRDYRTLLTDLSNDLTDGGDHGAAQTADMARVAAAVAESKRQAEYLHGQIEALKTDLAQSRREQNDAVAHRKAVESKLNELKQKIETGITSNREMAHELERLQTEALRHAS